MIFPQTSYLIQWKYKVEVMYNGKNYIKLHICIFTVQPRSYFKVGLTSIQWKKIAQAS